MFFKSTSIQWKNLNSFKCINIYNRYLHVSKWKKLQYIDSEKIPSKVTLSSIKKLLERHGRQFQDGFTCLSMPCVNCSNEKTGTMYINKVTGFFMCLECHDSGNWEFMENEIFRDSSKKKLEAKKEGNPKIKRKPVPHEGAARWNELKKTCSPVSSLTSEQKQRLVTHFNLVIGEHELLGDISNLLVDENRSRLYVALCQGSAKRVVGMKWLEVGDKEEHVYPREVMGVLRLARVRAERTVLVKSVRDFLALASLPTFNHQIVCLPNGCNSLPQEILPLLERYKKVVIWFGDEAIRTRSALMVAKKLGADRCYIVRSTSKDPCSFMTSVELDTSKVNDVIEKAQALGNKNITTFSSYRAEVWSELNNADKAEGVKWTRFPVLNKLLRGHRRGELTILTGTTGCGKTTFISDYCLDLIMQGVTTLWGSFEIRNQRLLRMMLQQMVSVPLGKHLDKFEEFADRFEQLPLYLLKFYGPQPIQSVMETVEHATYVHDIQHLVIDNLQFMMGACPSDSRFMDRFQKQDLVIGSLRSFATNFNCHVTLIIHPRKEKDADELTINSIFGGAKASQEADNVLIMQKKMLQSLHIKKYLQVVKNRYTGDLGVMALNFDRDTLCFGSKKELKS